MIPIPSYTHIDRFPELLEKFKTIQPAIDMSTFFRQDGYHEECQTSCCLAGWAIEWDIGTTPNIKKHWGSGYKASAGRLYVDNSVPNASVPVYQLMINWLFSGFWQLQIGPQRQHQVLVQRLQYVIDHKSCPTITTSMDNGEVHYSTVSISELMEAIPTCTIISGKSVIDYNKFGLFIEARTTLTNTCIISPAYPTRNIPSPLSYHISISALPRAEAYIAIPTDHTELAIQLLNSFESL